ncbi:MAG: type II secretion system F family protein [Actinomycetota bacterium]
MALALALAGAYGVFLVYTALALGWTGVGFGPAAPSGRAARRRAGDWLAQAGLEGVAPREFAAVVAVLFVVGAAVAYALFAGALPALLAGLFGATFPVASYRARRERRRIEAREAWPRMIEELRLQTGSLGRSIPQGLFEVGRHAPDELRPAFDAAEREWLLSTDFPRTVAVLKERLADVTADTTLETLLVAYEIGGSDLDRRLSALVEDRIQDLQGRKDAESKQAGVRFARRFVLIVPLGMTLAGLSIGTGREAYRTMGGQLAVAGGLAVVAACWLWAGRLMRLPDEQRVFHA